MSLKYVIRKDGSEDLFGPFDDANSAYEYAKYTMRLAEWDFEVLLLHIV